MRFAVSSCSISLLNHASGELNCCANFTVYQLLLMVTFWVSLLGQTWTYCVCVHIFKPVQLSSFCKSFSSLSSTFQPFFCTVCVRQCVCSREQRPCMISAEKLLCLDAFLPKPILSDTRAHTTENLNCSWTQGISRSSSSHIASFSNGQF